MDNLSHTVVGFAAGELLHRSLPEEKTSDHQRLRHRLMLTASVVASNFPDLDLVLTPLLPAPLGYLLHHRGHTHTLLYLLPQALLLWAAIWLLWPAARRLVSESRTARNGFLLATAAGFLLHLGMDYLNSYGLHPFHPFDSGWYYGDMIFILEPVFWIAFGIPTAMMVTNKIVRLFLITILVAVPLYFTTVGFLSWASFIALAMTGLLIGLAQQRSGERGRGGLLLALVVGLSFVGLQNIASHAAATSVAALLKARDGNSVIADIALTAFPSNPVCWNFVSVENSESKQSYRLRRGILSIAPSSVPVSDCPAGLSERASQREATAAYALTAEIEGNLNALRTLKKTDCHFEAWLRFARAPALDGAKASDLRYSTALRENFTTIDLTDIGRGPCATSVPQWEFPRKDLLK